MKPLFDYLDYRTYLKDFYLNRKSENAFFSYRLMAGKLDLDASQLVKILNGQRHISERQIKPVIEYLGLKGREAQFFETLVRFTKAKASSEVKQWYEKMLSIMGVKAQTLRKDQYEFFQQWYHSAILMALDLSDFRGDFAALGQQLSPPIVAAQVKKSIELLLRLGLVRIEESGRYVLTNQFFTTGEPEKRIAVRTFQKEMILLAAESLERHEPFERNISSVTITLKRRDMRLVETMIAEFRRSLLKLAEETDDPDRAYQFNIQLFPVTK